jgi:hypothetical protein
MFLLAVAMAAVFGFAFLFVIVLSLHLQDGSYSLSMAFDSGTLGTAEEVAIAAGVVVFFPFYFAARFKPLGKCVALLCVLVIGEIAVVTPRNTLAGFVGSFVAFGAGLVVAQLMPNLPPAAVGGT